MTRVNLADLRRTQPGTRRRGQRAGKALTPEQQVKLAIVQGLAHHGIPVRKLGVGSFKVGNRFVALGEAGTPDMCALLPNGVTLWIEAKAARGVLRPEQVEFRNLCLRQGVPHVVAKDWESVAQALRALEVIRWASPPPPHPGRPR